MKVLVVDDRATTQGELEAALRHGGCWTDHAGGGEEAMARLLASVPDAVVTDQVMHPMTGTELIKRMRGSSAWQGVPCVLITALADGPELQAVCVELQALQPARLLRKPFEPAALLKALKEMTGKLGG